MVNIYTEKDADLSRFDGKTVGIIGYGSQGHAHALNLHDSGVNVMVGLYEGSPSRENARNAGLTVDSVAEVTKASEVIMVAVPDHVQKDVYPRRDSAQPQPGRRSHVRPRIHHPLRVRCTATLRGCADDRAQGSRSPDA